MNEWIKNQSAFLKSYQENLKRLKVLSKTEANPFEELHLLYQCQILNKEGGMFPTYSLMEKILSPLKFYVKETEDGEIYVVDDFELWFHLDKPMISIKNSKITPFVSDEKMDIQKKYSYNIYTSYKGKPILFPKLIFELSQNEGIKIGQMLYKFLFTPYVSEIAKEYEEYQERKKKYDSEKEVKERENHLLEVLSLNKVNELGLGSILRRIRDESKCEIQVVNFQFE